MIKLYQILFETGPSAQGLGSYDKRMGIQTSLDTAEDLGLLDIADKLEDEPERENPESFETSEEIRIKSTP
jgi:hypothetical protein